MPKFAVVSDIHGNLPAFRAVVDDIDRIGVDGIFSLGDVVGYGPYPRECVDLVFNMDKVVARVGGNHEELLSLIDDDPDEADLRANINAQVAIRTAKNSLSEEQLVALSSLPAIKYLEEFDMGLAHGSYVDQEHRHTYLRDEEDVENEEDMMMPRILSVGHTHRPFFFCKDEAGKTFVRGKNDRSKHRFFKDSRIIFNPGSVGQPRDDDCRASYGVLYLGQKNFWFQIRRIPYNITETQMAMVEKGLPISLIERLATGT